MALSLDQLLTLIASGSTAAGPLLGLFIYALFKGWIVLGSTHRRALAELEGWKALTLKSLGVAEGAFQQARRKAEVGDESGA